MGESQGLNEEAREGTARAGQGAAEPGDPQRARHQETARHRRGEGSRHHRTQASQERWGQNSRLSFETKKKKRRRRSINRQTKNCCYYKYTLIHSLSEMNILFN